MRSLSEDDYKEIARYKDPSDFSTLSDTMYQFIADQKMLSDAIDEEISTPTLGDMRSATVTVPVRSVTGDIPVQSFEATQRIENPVRTAEFEALGADTRVDLPTPQREAPADDTGDTRVDIPTSSQGDGYATGSTVKIDAPKKKKKERHYTEYSGVTLTPRGKKFFVGGAVALSPVLLLLAIVFYGVFALCVASVVALIVALFVLLALLVMVGSVACLVGIVYGITQIFTSIGIGIYEIGVGIIASGVTIVVSVMVYTTATVAMPYIMRQLIAFFKHVMSRIPLLIERVKEECNKL